MYKEYFGLKENPFSIAPDPHYFYMSGGHREALAHLVYGVNSDGGFVLLTGEVGTGKTTVCRCLLDQLPENTDIAFIVNPKLTAEELLATICDEFGVRYPENNRSIKVFVSAINDYLLEAHGKGHRAVLIIDEAQNLSVEVLEQIRLLTNLETSQRKLLQIIMLGQPELREMLLQPQLRQLSQRITARYHLGPLSHQEIPVYVNHRLSVAGLVRGELFPPAILRALGRLTGGVPRLINVICDRALLGTYIQGKPRVDRKTLMTAVQEVSGRPAHQRKRRRVYQGIAAGFVLVICVSLALTFLPRNMKPLPATPAKTAPETPKAEEKIDNVVPPPPEKPDNPNPANTRDAAYQALFKKWKIDYSPADSRSVCDQALAQGLRCIEGKANLITLPQMNKPAVLKLLDGNGREYYTVLASLHGGTATLATSNGMKAVEYKDLGPQWRGDYLLLWRMPPEYREKMRPGGRGALVAWIEKQLATVQGRAIEAGRTRIYDDEMVRQVQEFQEAAGLQPDGIVGPVTVMRLSAAAGDGTPTLSSGRGSN
jgi:general secretion pathway protein A